MVTRKLIAKDLAALLLTIPDAEICVAYEVQGTYGSGTPFTDDEVEPVREIRQLDDKLVFTSSCYLYRGEQVWNNEESGSG